VAVIVNPAAGRGRGGRRLAEVRRAFADAGVLDVRVTQRPGEEEELARRALREGCSTLVAVGGDGTWSNVGHAIVSAGSRCRLALLAAGTGNDFARSVGAPAHDLAATVRLAVGGPDLPVDVGRVEHRHFLNVAGFGFTAAVLEGLAEIPALRGRTLYAASALRRILGFRGVAVTSSTGHDWLSSSGPLLLLVIANGQRFGGAFRIAPGASLTDGELDCVAIREVSAPVRLRLFAAATRGRHVRHPAVRTERAARFGLRFPSPPAYDTDGEVRRAGSAELEVTCVPRALRVVVPRSAHSSPGS
jgi:diacylglycerol kinase (ATP)